MRVAGDVALGPASLIFPLLVSPGASAGELLFTCADGAGLAVVAGRDPLPLPALAGGIEGTVAIDLRRTPLGLAERAVTVTVGASERVVVDICAPDPVVSLSPLGIDRGDLYVDVGIAGASVRVDGVDRGASPLMLRDVATGMHVVEARGTAAAGGCGRASQVVKVEAGAIARADLRLEEGAGALVVAGRPEGAVVVIDGESAGTVPLDVPSFACGAHRVEVGETGFVTDGRDLLVHAGELVRFQADLQAEERGSLSIDVSPLSASVRLDGTPLGTGPRTVTAVLAGPHQLVAEAEGYRPLALDVTVSAGENLRAELELRRSVGAGRVVLNTAVTAVGAASAVGAVLSFVESERAFSAFLDEPDNAEAQRIYDDEVRPADTATWVLGAGAVAGLGGGVALWTLSAGPVPTFTTRF